MRYNSQVNIRGILPLLFICLFVSKMSVVLTVLLQAPDWRIGEINLPPWLNLDMQHSVNHHLYQQLHLLHGENACFHSKSMFDCYNGL